MEVAAHKPDESSPPARRKPTARARVSNGRDVLPNVDGRSLIARRYRDIADAILVDQGGAARCSESRVQLVRRFAAASVLAEQLEARLANGEQIDIAEHATLSSTLVRLAQRIGIDRVARDVGGLSIGDIMRAAAAGDAVDSSEGVPTGVLPDADETAPSEPLKAEAAV